MAGITSIKVKESLEDLAVQLQKAKTLKARERLQVLYWLKQDNPPNILMIAKAIGKHRNTLQTWLKMYRTGGFEAMWEMKQSPGGRGKSHSTMGGRCVSKTITSPRTWICQL